MFYKLTEDKRAVPCKPEEFSLDIDHRRVGLTTHREGMFNVSTVFLGLDHNYGGGEPHVYETLVEINVPLMEKEDECVSYGWGLPAGLIDGVVARYSTWAEAEQGHKEIVEALSKWAEERQT